ASARPSALARYTIGYTQHFPECSSAREVPLSSLGSVVRSAGYFTDTSSMLWK
ncbi:hypothetical protein ACTXT7_017570, partial [Hymenolepis weldensis]